MDRFGYLGLVAQSFALFVGLSILLGRVYFQSYVDALGIPLSEANLNVIDYSVVATRVTILGIAIPVIYFVINVFGSINRPSEWHISNIGTGVLCIAFAAAYLLIIDKPEEQAFASGRESLYVALMYGLSAAGGSIIVSGIPRDSGTSERGSGEFNYRRVIAPLFYVFLAVIVLGYSLGYASDAGRIDASHTLEESRRARLEFATSGPGLVDEACLQETQECYFKVVLIGDEFVYLLPDDAGNSPSSENLYAIPIYDVSMIAYTD